MIETKSHTGMLLECDIISLEEKEAFMKLKELDKIMEEHKGYGLPYPTFGDYFDQYDSCEFVDIDEEYLCRILNFDPSFSRSWSLSEEENVLRLFRLTCPPHHITLKELLDNLDHILEISETDEDFCWEDVIDWTYQITYDLFGNPLFLPEMLYRPEEDDFRFDNDDHLVAFVIDQLKNYTDYMDGRDDVLEMQSFIREILEQRKYEPSKRHYSESTLNHILFEMDVKNCPTEEKLEFYREGLIYLANQEKEGPMRELAYAYYTGDYGFPIDFEKSLHWLEKTYEKNHNPFIANTIGYIYYYGRTTNGVPQGDKAFQYFSIGMNAGKCIESIYKVADCYVKGYGTPINHQAAYNLVSDLYEWSLKEYLEGRDNKFADVALRMGSYYWNGIHVDKDLDEALEYFLIARYAILKRLKQKEEYVGDRGVSASICKSIDAIAKELDIQQREIQDSFIRCPLDDHYQFFSDVKVKAKKLEDDKVKITIQNKEKEQSILFVLPSALYCEFTPKLTFVVRSKEMTQKRVDKLNSYKEIDVTIDEDSITFDLTKDKKKIYVDFDIEEMFYLPKEKEYKNLYQVVSVSYSPDSDKTYDYICPKRKVKVGDKLTIDSQGTEKEVIVKEVKQLYEDELPLPREKMGITK